jgi:anti-anti-sigma factor
MYSNLAPSTLPPTTTRLVCRQTELVRGVEQALVDEVAALLRAGSVLLDLDRVERIDAAGIAALIRLYRIAEECGCQFAVVHPSRHVKELLELVGLEGVLVSHITGEAPQSGFFSAPFAA